MATTHALSSAEQVVDPVCGMTIDPTDAVDGTSEGGENSAASAEKFHLSCRMSGDGPEMAGNLKRTVTSDWHSRCCCVCIVMSMRLKLSAAIVSVAVLVMTGAPLLAACGAAQQLDCHKTPRLAQCCCCDDGEISNQPGLTQARTNIVGDHQSAVSAVPGTIVTLRSGAASCQVDTSPPRGHSPDLPILFADLRL